MSTAADQTTISYPTPPELIGEPHAYAPIMGLDEAGDVVLVTIGRKA